MLKETAVQSSMKSNSNLLLKQKFTVRFVGFFFTPSAHRPFQQNQQVRHSPTCLPDSHLELATTQDNDRLIAFPQQ
jgi:hypothetical protein